MNLDCCGELIKPILSRRKSVSRLFGQLKMEAFLEGRAFDIITNHYRERTDIAYIEYVLVI